VSHVETAPARRREGSDQQRLLYDTICDRMRTLQVHGCECSQDSMIFDYLSLSGANCRDRPDVDLGLGIGIYNASKRTCLSSDWVWLIVRGHQSGWTDSNLNSLLLLENACLDISMLLCYAPERETSAMPLRIHFYLKVIVTKPIQCLAAYTVHIMNHLCL
jgi:hypothetical protein